MEAKENVRNTMYSEILDVVLSYETGFAEALRNAKQEKGIMLSGAEADQLFKEFESMRLWEPLREKARVKMVSRDHCFRDIIHQNLAEYIHEFPASDFNRFLGEKSKELDERLMEYREMLLTIKDRSDE